MMKLGEIKRENKLSKQSDQTSHKIDISEEYYIRRGRLWKRKVVLAKSTPMKIENFNY